MTNDTQIAVIETSAPSEADLATQQLIAIDPAKYVSLVFASVAEKLAQYKREADAIPAPDVTTTAGMKTAVEWRAKFRDEIRLATESARRERKAPILDIARRLDGRAKEITQESAPYEARFDDAIKDHEAKLAAAKKAREEAERTRLAEIQRRLVKLESLGSGEIYTSAMAPERLQDILQQLEAPPVFDYAECGEQAAALRQRAIVAIRQAHVEALERIERENAERAAREAEEARIAAERAEEARIAAEARAAEEARLAEVRRRLDEEKAEQARQAAERRAADEQRAREERERLEAERKDQARVAQIRQWIVALNGPTHLTATDSPLLIELARKQLLGAVIDEHYGEFHTEAAEAREAGVQRLTALRDAAAAYRAEQDRLATERTELERQQREQAERQAEIERKEQEAREAEEMRRAMAVVEEANRAAEAARAREAEERAAALRKRIASLTAEEIARIVANAIGCCKDEIAERIAAIEHDDWVALAISDAQEEAA